MEQTIGKRIMTLRKSRGLTQEQLAERVGVTAQAVSKWENDMSCPDISLLPRLAEVFQVTTDSLLGVPEKTEVVDQMPSGIHINIGDGEEEADNEKNGFSFHWDFGGRGLPWFATAVLLFAVSMLLNRTLLQFLGRASAGELMWPAAVLSWGLCGLWDKVSLWSIGLTAYGGYWLLTNLHILNLGLELPWNIIVLALLIIWAVSALVKNFRK